MNCGHGSSLSSWCSLCPMLLRDSIRSSGMRLSVDRSTSKISIPTKGSPKRIPHGSRKALARIDWKRKSSSLKAVTKCLSGAWLKSRQAQIPSCVMETYVWYHTMTTQRCIGCSIHPWNHSSPAMKSSLVSSGKRSYLESLSLSTSWI